MLRFPTRREQSTAPPTSPRNLRAPKARRARQLLTLKLQSQRQPSSPSPPPTPVPTQTTDSPSQPCTDRGLWGLFPEATRAPSPHVPHVPHVPRKRWAFTWQVSVGPDRRHLGSSAPPPALCCCAPSYLHPVLSPAPALRSCAPHPDHPPCAPSYSHAIHPPSFAPSGPPHPVPTSWPLSCLPCADVWSYPQPTPGTRALGGRWRVTGHR